MPDLSILSSEASALQNVTGGADLNILWLILPIVLLLLLSALFSAAAEAYSLASKTRLRGDSEEHVKHADKAIALLEKGERTVYSMIVGATLSDIVLTVLLVALMIAVMPSVPLACLVAAAVGALLVLLVGEVLPRTFVRNDPERAACSLQAFTRVARVLLTPVTALFMGWKNLLTATFKLGKGKGITEEDLVTIVETAESEGELDSHESRLIKNAIEFEDTDVRDIMVPRVSVTAVEDTESPDDVAEVFRRTGYSRLPVYHDTIDSVVGILNEKDFNLVYFTGKDKSFASVVTPSVTVAPTMKISAVLRTLQRAKMHMAIVVDEFGGTAGVVTLEDIIEELVGEIWDEHDAVQEESLKRIGDDEYVAGGFANVFDVFERLGVEAGEDFDATTIGGWVTEEMGTIPPVGGSFRYENVVVTVSKANAKRVLEVRIKVLPKAEETTGER